MYSKRQSLVKIPLAIVEKPLRGRSTSEVEPSVRAVGVDCLNVVIDSCAIESTTRVIESITVEAVGFAGLP